MEHIVVMLAISTLLTLYHLSFGVAEAIILSDTADAKGECGAAIWYNILVLCVIHFINGVTTPCLTLARVSSDGEKSSGGSNGMLISLGLAIWSCVIYFDTSSECKAHFQDAYPDLWNCVEGEVVVFFIALAILGALLIGGLIYACFACFTKEY